MKNTLVIIPTYNEVNNVSRIISSVFSQPLDIDILIVDDNSPDGTSLLIKKLIKNNKKKLFLLERKKKVGLGAAYVAGFLWGIKKKYDFIFEMDADFSHDPSCLPDMVDALKNKTDVIVGSRYKEGINVVNWPLGRILLSYSASLYVRVITGMPVKDPTAGYVGYKRKVLESLQLNKIQFVGYAFQIEMKYKSWKNNFKIHEYPIIFKNRTIGKSKMDLSIFWEAIIGVIKMRFF
tara:strand:+ start:2538 stop:3242 length:705 start_codon:yes stop_codon:yes gene_type:complete